MSPIPDITETELWIVGTTLKERHGVAVATELADAEVRIAPTDRELTSCPVIYWTTDGCHFVVFKTGERAWRCQFYYQPYKQMGTGRHEYDDLAECVVGLLQAQADFSAEQRGDLPSPRR